MPPFDEAAQAANPVAKMFAGGSVDAYLDKELGVSAADVAKLRAMYLE
jgi:hypothetical protein